MDLNFIFSDKYLFDWNPTRESNLYLYLLILFSALILISVLVGLSKKIDTKIKVHQLYCFVTCGFLGLIYLFARYEGLPYLGSRLFLVLIILALFVWSITIIIWMKGYLAERNSENRLKNRFEKYLPKKKSLK